MRIHTGSSAIRLLGLAWVMLVAVSARAETTNWFVNPAGGAFETGANWDTGATPYTLDDNAVFSNVTGTITFAAPVTNRVWYVQRGNVVFDIGEGRTNWLYHSLYIGATNPLLAQANFTSGVLTLTNGIIFIGRNVWPGNNIYAHASSTNVLVVSGSNTMITSVNSAGMVIFIGGVVSTARLIVTNGAAIVWPSWLGTKQSRVQVDAPPAPSVGQTNLLHVTGQGSRIIVYGNDSASRWSSLSVRGGTPNNGALALIDDGGYFQCSLHGYGGVNIGARQMTCSAVLRVSGVSTGGVPSELAYFGQPLNIAGKVGPDCYLNGTVEILEGGRITAGNWNNENLNIGVATNATVGRITIAGSNSLFSFAGPARGFTNQVGLVGAGTGYLTVTNYGMLRTTNTMGRAKLDIQNGVVTLASSGQIIVDQLLMTNATASFSFRGGTLDITNAVISNGVPFTVGDGIQSATLSLRGGTNAFWHTCVIQTNATLTGVGYVQGVVTNFGTIAPGRSGPGTLSVSNLLTMMPASTLDYQLGEPGHVGGGTNDLIVVQGDVRLTGQLRITPLATFTNGTYTILTYSGSLLENTLTLSPDRPHTHLYNIRVSGNNVLLDVRRNPPGTIISFSKVIALPPGIWKKAEFKRVLAWVLRKRTTVRNRWLSDTLIEMGMLARVSAAEARKLIREQGKRGWTCLPWPKAVVRMLWRAKFCRGYLAKLHRGENGCVTD